MTFDGTISLGNILTSAAFLLGLWAAATRTYHSLDKRASIFEATISAHSLMLTDHAKRMEKQDELLVRIMGEMQRLLGRMDANTAPDVIARAAVTAQTILHTAEETARHKLAAAEEHAERIRRESLRGV